MLAQARNEPRSAQADFDEKRTEHRPTGEGVSTRRAILHQSDQPDNTHFNDAKAESEKSHASSSDVFFYEGTRLTSTRVRSRQRSELQASNEEVPDVILTLVRTENAQHAYTDGHEDSHNEQRGQAEEHNEKHEVIGRLLQLSPISLDGQGELNRRLQSHCPRHSQRKQLLVLTCCVGRGQREKQTHSDGSSNLGNFFYIVRPVVVVDSSPLKTAKADEAAGHYDRELTVKVVNMKEENLRAHCKELSDRKYPPHVQGSDDADHR